MRKPWIAALATGAAAMLIAAPEAGAAPTGMLTLTGKPSQKMIDLAPKGESVGDQLITSETLRSSSGRAARLEAVCVLVDKTYQGALCSATLIFRDGELTLAGATLSKAVPHIGGRGNTFAILGGTGRYTGAAGTAKLQSIHRRDHLTIRFAS